MTRLQRKQSVKIWVLYSPKTERFALAARSLIVILRETCPAAPQNEYETTRRVQPFREHRRRSREEPHQKEPQIQQEDQLRGAEGALRRKPACDHPFLPKRYENGRKLA